MGHISSGYVIFGDGLKKEEYGALRKAEVKLVFEVAEGEDYTTMLTTAQERCRAKVYEMLKGVAPSHTPTQQAVLDAVKPATQPATPAGDAPKPNKAAGQTKAEKDAAKKAFAEKQKAEEEAKRVAAGGTTDVDPMDDTPNVGGGVQDGDVMGDTTEPGKPAASTDTGASAEVDDSLFSAEVVQVTDADLLQKITARNAAIKNPTAIRTLIGKYVNPPKTAKDIPAASRATFLKQLAALEPAKE